ncbi:uncharacterized protein LOC114534508 [Dendronephthya gigantea]|uniref:uncharacterized protein LOC114534508 n=1 Tax=Dendronephthya gigantea TaxID=151771 RepID=UPI00106AB3B0|nr:uncharacterized protein LOC114534508 [Dendronephthya gigantea]
MNLSILVLLCALILSSTTASFMNYFSDDATADIASIRLEMEALANELKSSKEDSKKLNTRLGALTRQMMLQQLFIEERLRSEGQSGVKQTRNGKGGTKSYYHNSHGGRRIVAIHDHSNNIRTVGMGEFIGVLNGVEFRTRHNDYRLYMPSSDSSEFHKTEDLPFPEVPSQVTNKSVIAEQVEEMVEWFKAWKNEDHSVRDYRKYFKPVLCYLEGTWTKNSKNIDEPFESDRHFVDASSWFDLQEKIRFTSYNGRKDNSENLAYLPTTIMETVDETTAVFAQWNYRILCHPLKDYLPVNRLRMVDELASRLASKRTVEEQLQTRAARFQVNPKDKDTWKDGVGQYGLLDELMSQIPGKDNYPANIVDDALGQVAYSLDPKKKDQILNAGYYHRWYKVKEKGAMGVQTRHRGFSDPNLFVAMTKQPNVAGMKLNVCKEEGDENICTKYEQKVSYAIPLEIIYLTPLNRWNPYNLSYKGDQRSDEGKTVTANKRDGGKTPLKAYDGINSKIYYITPNEFFEGTETHVDAADTTQGSVGVLDQDGEVRMVRASGTRIFLPNIPGVGILRTRYPIMPIHAEGSTAWKEIQAVGDFVMQSGTHAHLFREKLAAQEGATAKYLPEENTDVVLRTGKATLGGIHYHEVTLSAEQVSMLKTGGEVTMETSLFEDHQHTITIKWKKTKHFYMAWCDSTPEITKPFKAKCFDKHLAVMTVVQNV